MIKVPVTVPLPSDRLAWLEKHRINTDLHWTVSKPSGRVDYYLVMPESSAVLYRLTWA